MIAALRSVLFALAFYTGTVPLALGAAAVAPVSEQAVFTLARAWARWYVWSARVFAGVRLIVRGTVPQAGIVAIKHQSAFDAILSLYLFDRPAVVMKAELRKLPVWGYAAYRHGSIFVERDRRGGALLGMLRQARKMATAGRPVVLFPEGTRVPVGAAPPLRAGLSGLYAALDQPVTPIAGNSGRAWPKGFIKRPGTITLKVGEAVPPGLERDAMEALVHAGINADPLA